MCVARRYPRMISSWRVTELSDEGGRSLTPAAAALMRLGEDIVLVSISSSDSTSLRSSSGGDTLTNQQKKRREDVPIWSGRSSNQSIVPQLRAMRASRFPFLLPECVRRNDERGERGSREGVCGTLSRGDEDDRVNSCS